MNENAQKLVAALRSGEFKQCSGRLARQTDDGPRYCCLGVACELYRRETGDGEWGGNAAIGRLCFISSDSAFLHTSLLPKVVTKWLGFTGSAGDHIVESQPITLATLNDSQHFSFREIADVIESEPEGMFA